MEIRAKTIAEAHVKVCREIFEEGVEIVTEDGEITIEYPEPIMIIVTRPNMPPRISSFNNFNERAMKVYQEQFTSINPSGFAYTYGNRILDYPIVIEDENLEGRYATLTDSGYGDGLNQIDWVVDMLVKNPESRRAVITIRSPEIDCDSVNPPCLTVVQFMIRGKTLHTTAYFRSNDMLSAWCNNANGLFALSDMVGRKIFDINPDICYGTGALTTFSNSAHMYFKRDAEEMKKMKLEVYK